MRALAFLTCLLLSGAQAHGYQYWNSIRHSALLPAETVTIRTENPSGAGIENYLLYEGTGIEAAAMIPVMDGPSTISATVPGPVTETRRYGFRLVDGDELDLFPVAIAEGVAPDPGDLTQLAPDPVGDALFGYTNLDLVDCHVSFSDTRLFASLTNAGGGFPVNQGLTFFAYLFAIANPALADPDTVFALMYTIDQPGIITPGLYRITGSGLGDLERIGDVEIDVFSSLNTLLLSCELADLMADPYFMEWYDPLDPALGVAAFTQRITLTGGVVEADRSAGGDCYLRELAIAPFVNTLPVLTNPVFQGMGSAATAAIDYADPDGHCPVLSEIVFDGAEAYPLYPLTLDYEVPVTYRTEAGIQPLATGSWSSAVFRFSDNETDVIAFEVHSTGVSVDDPCSFIASVSSNPSKRQVEIQVAMPNAGRAQVEIYDASGALMSRLFDGLLGAGLKKLSWQGRRDGGCPACPGIYFMRLEALGHRELHKIVLVR